jgi:hypothetical protein
LAATLVREPNPVRPKMYHTNSHFVFTVTRDFVRNWQTPC